MIIQSEADKQFLENQVSEIKSCNRFDFEMKNSQSVIFWTFIFQARQVLNSKFKNVSDFDEK